MKLTDTPEAQGPITCEACNQPAAEVVSMPSTFTMKSGKTVSYADEFSRCSKCGEEFYTKDQSLANSRAVTAAVRAADNLPSSEDIRNARLRLSMTLEEFERALSVGKNTVGRWERGTVPPSGAATAGLWLAIHRPDVFREFAASRGIAKKQRALAATVQMSGTSAQTDTGVTLRLETGDRRYTAKAKQDSHGTSHANAPESVQA